MEDPLSQLHDRPHRYLLESDSSDEEGQGIYGTNESGPSTIPKPKIQTSQEYTVDDVDITGGSWDSYEEIILGVEQSGRYLVRRLGVKGDADVTVNVGGRTMGSGWGIGRRLLLIMGEGEQETLHILAHALLANSGTRPWMIVSTYLPSMYIPDRALSLPTAPIRHVTIHGAQIIDKTVDGAEPLSSPNYVTGLAAALLSNIARPSASRVSAALALLPLPLSSLATTELATVLSSLSPNGPLAFAQKGAAWTEDDDEPFAQAGMGVGKNRSRVGARGADVGREVDGMYM